MSSDSIRYQYCPQCRKPFPHTEEFFHKDRARKYGLRTICKLCACSNKVEKRRDNLEVSLEKERKDYARNSEKKRQYQRESYAKNPDKHREAAKRHYQKTFTPELRREKRLKYRDDERESHRKWLLAHPDQNRAYSRKRRARKLSAGGSHSVEEIKQLYREQDGLCFHCKVDLSSGYHVDHWIPLSKGGSDYIENIRLLCPPCNLSKNNKLPHEWDSRYSSD